MNTYENSCKIDPPTSLSPATGGLPVDPRTVKEKHRYAIGNISTGIVISLDIF
jgi:hypothetical protein